MQLFYKRYNFILNGTSFLQTVQLYFKSTLCASLFLLFIQLSLILQGYVVYRRHSRDEVQRSKKLIEME